MSGWAVALVNLVVTVGLLWVMPLGLRMIEAPGIDVVRRAWWGPALLAVVSLWLPRGVLSTVLSVPYAVLTVGLALTAAARFAARRSLAPVEIAAMTALVGPSIAAIALVAERASFRLFGFSLTRLELTVPHLHYAGFVAALVAGLVAGRVRSRQADFAALTVPAGTFLVLIGHFVGDPVELAGALVLTAGMWTVAVLTWRDVRPATERTTRTLLEFSSLVLAATMLLAVWYAAGRTFDFVHPNLDWMVATHGVLNALGFGLCAVLAHRRLSGYSQATPSSSRSSAER